MTIKNHKLSKKEGILLSILRFLAVSLNSYHRDNNEFELFNLENNKTNESKEKGEHIYFNAWYASILDYKFTNDFFSSFFTITYRENEEN